MSTAVERRPLINQLFDETVTPALVKVPGTARTKDDAIREAGEMLVVFEAERRGGVHDWFLSCGGRR